ncbi:MAG: dicarboxylate/amino acid:cation symporter [Treponema sp.]|nr:dicarboxylate/amino acid:cation symporter [Treponema sp.]
MRQMQIPANINELPGALEFIRTNLSAKKVPKKEIARTLLATEDVLVKMIETAKSNISIVISGLLGTVEIRLYAKGEEFNSSDIEKKLLMENTDSGDEETNAIIHQLMQKLYGNNFLIKHENGANKISLLIKKSPLRQLFFTISSLIAGAIAGFLLQKFTPAAVSTSLSQNIFSPIYVMFMNSLKMVVGPLVFFSIASSIADFGDIKTLGKIALKIIFAYFCTSFIAIAIGYLAYNIFPIGNPELANAITASATHSTSISIKDTIIGIIPNNIISPFEESKMLQIIYLATALGLAAASVAKADARFKSWLIIFNKIFSKLTSFIVGCIPVVVFCSMAKMMISLNIDKLLNVIVWIPVVYFGQFLMITTYLILIAVVGGLNPFKFLEKFFPAMLSAFSLASSSAALPTSLKQSEEMGISKKIYSFSMPLGTTINLDGTCVTVMISLLFLSKIFGISVTGGLLLSMIIAIIMISVGSSIPGGALLGITLLLPQIGVPADAVSLIMGLYPIADMFQTCTNVTGDGVVTTIVSRHEKMLDLKKFNS